MSEWVLNQANGDGKNRTEQRNIWDRTDRMRCVWSRRLWAGWLEMPLIHSWERFLCNLGKGPGKNVIEARSEGACPVLCLRWTSFFPSVFPGQACLPGPTWKCPVLEAPSQMELVPWDGSAILPITSSYIIALNLLPWILELLGLFISLSPLNCEPETRGSISSASFLHHKSFSNVKRPLTLSSYISHNQSVAVVIFPVTVWIYWFLHSLHTLPAFSAE